jgi:hypothetical protein
MKKIILFIGISLVLGVSQGVNAQLFDPLSTYVIKTVVPVAYGSFAVGDTVIWAGIPAADAVRTKGDGIYPYLQSSYDVKNSQFLWTIQPTLKNGTYTYTISNKLNGLINFWANASQSMYLGKLIGSYPISFTITPATDSNGKPCYNVLGPNNIYLSDSIDARATNAVGCMNTTTAANPQAPFPSIYIQVAPGTGLPADLVAAYTNLVPGGSTDLTNVTGNLTLPAAAGNVAITWVSSNLTVLSSTGVVTQPAKYDALSILTATLTETVAGVTYTLTKTFTVTVKAVTAVSDQLAEWNFTANNIALTNGAITVTDIQSGFVGTLKNEARVRTIGSTADNQFNVLDLGNGTGYFDMGAEIGKAIYSLTDYTICGYFFIDNNYQELGNNGNFYWTFSNSTDENTDQNGYIIGELKVTGQDITPKYWNSNDQFVGSGKNAPKGAWHHLAYTQSGTTGSIYVDGVLANTGSVTNLPATTLPIAGRTGTLYNWLGRPNYIDNVYLRQTMLYDFQLLKVALTDGDFASGYGDGATAVDGVPDMLDKLNAAYIDNPDYTDSGLKAEMDNLKLPDLSALTQNINLPVKGTLDNTIEIAWRSSTPDLISPSGVVTRPKFYNYNDTLTATLFKNGQSLTKSFPATVLVKDGTVFQNNLLVKYDFSKVTSDSIVTDAAEQHVQGILKNDAKVQSIGSSVKFNVLNLGDSIGYFDMGTDVGKMIYHLNNFTIGAYYHIDAADSTNLKKNGNILWSFCDTRNIEINPIGYVVGNLKIQAETISKSNSNGEQTVKEGTAALTGSWHHIAYTQKDTIGTIFIDGMNFASGTVKELPSSLTRAGQLGILYNWMGRSCYASDVYLRKTLVYDFRLYNTALTEDQIMNSVLNVSSTIPALEKAYTEGPNAVNPVLDSQYKVIPSAGEIHIQGLNGSEKVWVSDITGRRLVVVNPSLISARAGVYIVRINGYVTKVVVR